MNEINYKWVDLENQYCDDRWLSGAYTLTYRADTDDYTVNNLTSKDYIWWDPSYLGLTVMPSHATFRESDEKHLGDIEEFYKDLIQK